METIPEDLKREIETRLELNSLLKTEIALLKEELRDMEESRTRMKEDSAKTKQLLEMANAILAEAKKTSSGVELNEMIKRLREPLTIRDGLVRSDP